MKFYSAKSACSPEEILCPESKRCILRKWICDGLADCSDGSDEKNCGEYKEQSQNSQKTTGIELQSS